MAALPIAETGRQPWGAADRLRLQTLAWLNVADRLRTVAHDPSSDKVPTFLCWRLGDGELAAVAGDRYAKTLERWLLIGEYPVDRHAVRHRAIALAKTEAELIRHDAALYWLHNVNYPGLIKLLQNSFYALTPAATDERLNQQLHALTINEPAALTAAQTQVEPWLFGSFF